MDNIRTILQVKNIDCLVVTETWFNDNHTDSLVSVPGYCCLRDDRERRIGGGVAIWTKASLCPQEMSLPDKLSGVEAVAMKLNCKVFIIGCYIPPQIVSSSHDLVLNFLTELIDFLLTQHPTYDVILCGDFNRLRVDFLCRFCNLVNLHNDVTYGNAELDYVLISENISASYSVSKAEPIDTSTVHHSSLLAIPSTVHCKNLKSCRQVFDLRESNVANFVCELSNYDWSFIESDSMSINEKCLIFHSFLNTAFSKTIPAKVVNFTNTTKPWITPLIKGLINDRWKAYRRHDFVKYNHLKEKVKKEIEKSKCIWANKFKGTDIWKITSDILGRKTNDPMNCYYSQFENVTLAADFINRTFCTFHSVKQTTALPCSAANFVNVSETQVCNLLKKLPTHKASPDLPSKLYKAAACILSQPLARLFSLSIETSVVPDVWKIAAVSPFPKTRLPSSADDLRPISLLPIPSKILERVILQHAKPLFLQAYGNDQYGFRAGSSTSCALIALHDHITSSLDKLTVAGVQVIAYDFSKAFDRVRHDVIIKRLIECEMPAQLILWIASYLHGRKQYVKIGNNNSSCLEVTSGVPQGSVLGPFLFSVVIGSLTFPSAECRVIKYADDVTISIPLYKDNDNAQVFEIHNRISEWSSNVGLPLNLTKSQTMILPRVRDCHGISIQGVRRVDELTVLGVTFDTRCSWSAHVDNIATRASRRLFPLRILKPFVSHDSLRTIYYGIMRSVMEYAAPLLTGLTTKDSRKLQTLQNRFHRILCGRDCQEQCMPPLAERRMCLTMNLFRKSLAQDGHILRPLLYPISAHGNMILPAIRTTRRLKSFAVQTALLFNNNS